MNQYRIESYKGIVYKMILQHEVQGNVGKVKCDCGQILKEKEKLETHVNTKSHHIRLQNRYMFNKPTGTLLYTSNITGSGGR